MKQALWMAAVAALAGCSSNEKKPEPKKSLYERCGGTNAIAAVIDDFVDRGYANRKHDNPDVVKGFAETPKAGFKFHLTSQVIQLTGGPYAYHGRDTKEGHKHLNIRDQDWDLAIDDFRATCAKFKVPADLEKELVDLLASAKPAVVTGEKHEGPRPELPKPAGDSLYARLGGTWAIASVVDTFIDKLVDNEKLNANPKIKAARDKVPAAALKFQVTALVIEATGGPVKYQGRSMKDSHAHLDITSAEWDEMVRVFKDVLDSYKVPEKEQKELFDIIGSTKADIVTK